MNIQKMPCVCICGHHFDGELVVQAPIKLFVASIDALRCPKCGGDSKKISLLPGKAKD